MVHEWREWRAVNASASQSYDAFRGSGSSGTEEDVLVMVAVVGVLVAAATVGVGVDDGLFQKLFVRIPIMSCTWMSFGVPEPLGKSTPKSRPVQCEFMSISCPRALKSRNDASSPPSYSFLLLLLACLSLLSTSITGLGGSIGLAGVMPCSENSFHEYFPWRLEGLYEHVKPFIRQRSHTGCFLSHFILAEEQASQVDRSRHEALDTDIGLSVGVCRTHSIFNGEKWIRPTI